jgi:hypothetical protein
MGHIDEAQPLYARAVAILQKTLGLNHPEVAETRAGYARLGIEETKVVQTRSNNTGDEATLMGPAE